MLTFDETDCCTSDGYWTNLYSGIVFDGEDGGCGSMPRDVYDDDPDYVKRKALHEEVMAPLRTLLELEAAERARLNKGNGNHTNAPPVVEQVRTHLERLKAIRALMRAHRLTVEPGTH